MSRLATRLHTQLDALARVLPPMREDVRAGMRAFWRAGRGLPRVSRGRRGAGRVVSLMQSGGM